MIKEPHWKVHYRIRMSQIWSWIVQVTPKDLTIKYHTEGSACSIENVRLNRLKTGLNLDKIEDDIEEDRESRSKNKMDNKFLIKTVPNCKNIFGSELDEGLYTNHKALVMDAVAQFSTHSPWEGGPKKQNFWFFQKTGNI